MAKEKAPGADNDIPSQSAREKDEGVADVFWANSVFSDPASVFTSKPLTLSEVKDSASIVLDTNALLVPYGIGAESMVQIENTYSTLLNEKRLFIPAQVAREFARNRVKKLTELHQKLVRRAQFPDTQQGNYPLLAKVPEYIELAQIEKRLASLLAEYRKSLRSLIDKVASWEWNDPVSILYAKLFTAEVVVDTTKPKDEIQHEHTRRFRNRIPPGYKDAGKDDGGIGDFLIWLTILQIGATHNASVVFVSGDEKADWWHRSENQHLYPRFELVDEFRRESKGRSFHIIRLSQLLDLFGASAPAVEEVRDEEEVLSIPQAKAGGRPASIKAFLAEHPVESWFKAKGYIIRRAPDCRFGDFYATRDAKPLLVSVVFLHHGIALTWRLYRKLSELDGGDVRNLVMVFVGDDADLVNSALADWASLGSNIPAWGGILSSGQTFIPVRGFEVYPN